MTRIFFLLYGILALEVSAFGLQHGLFRSQATQGPAWTGTAEIVTERYVMTVHPDYLEVELDWEFGVGGTKPAQHENALEIVGNINFERKSTVTGMLVWYKDMILKGKLKTTAHARKEYEEVVDRNSPIPPKPRDPVLLEWIAEDNYDISIFPVEWGGTRKVRIRYLVPIQSGALGYPHAFSDKARVTLKTGKGVKGFILVNNDTAQEYSDPVVELPREEFEFQSYAWNSTKRNPTAILPVLQDSLTTSRMFLGSFSGGFPGNFSGHMAHIYLKVPRALLGVESPSGAAKVHAVLRSGTDSCKKAVGYDPVDDGPVEMFRLFSTQPLLESITWTLHSGDTLIREMVERPTVVRVEDARDYARSFGGVPFYPMASTMPKSLGVTLGFIDKRYSLVALETDALPLRVAESYWQGGMPTLEPGDIYPDQNEEYRIPLETWLGDRSLSLESLLQPSYANPINGTPISILGSQLPSGIRFRIEGGILRVEIDPKVLSSGLALACSVQGVDGRLIRAWRTEELRAGLLTWAPSGSGRASGAYYLKISLGNRHYSQAFHFWK